MTWLAWRLHGFEVRFVLAMAALFAVLLVPGRLVVATDLSRDVKILATAPVFPVGLLAIVAPALLGMFLGAPLVAADLEAGTHRLAWMQSVSRQRWLLVHVALVLGASIAALALVGAALDWALQPLFARAEPPTQAGLFDAIAILPAAYAVFAVGLGVALGALTQRVPVAMFLALVLFTTVRVFVANTLRPNFRAPGSLDPFWTLQAVEAGIFVALGALLLAAAWWQVTRRLT
jgi:hypothetical protein